jgi:branched-chain amino acid transport system substrate-binding protein
MGEGHEERDPVTAEEGMSRRDFLKLAGVAGAAVGLSGGLGGLLAACGGEEATTTTAGPTTTAGVTTTAGPTTTMAASTTTVSAGPEPGRALKIGVVSPKTGNFSVFAISDDWWIGHAKEALKDGLVTGDGKLRQIEIVVKDSQSDSQRASQVAGELVQSEKVDMLLASGTPDTCNPVSAQGEVLATPTLNSFAPWQALFYDATGKLNDYKWIFGSMLGSEQTIASFTDAFETSGVATNKKVGMLFQNDADAQGWMAPNAAPAVFKEKGYTLVVPQYYSIPAEDFTQQITQFKNEGCEIICGTNDPPWFSNFLKQALQQGFKPKFISSGKALIFPQATMTYPNSGVGLIGECSWHPSWKIKDTLSDLDSVGLAADYEAKTGEQWTPAIGCYAKFEWAIDVYKRAKNPEDKESVLEAIKSTNNIFQQGKVDLTSPVDPNTFHPIPNVYKNNIGAQQWVKGTKWPIEPVEVSNATAPGTTVQAKAMPMAY